MYRALYLQRQLVILCYLDFKVLCCLGLLLLQSISFQCKLCLSEQDISRSMSISIRYMYIKTSNHVYNACPQVYPLLSTNVGESLLHGLIVAHFRINQIYIKTDEIKMKPYLHQNHSIGYVSLFVDFFHLQKQPNSSQCHMLYDNLFYLSNNGIWNSVFHVFVKT